MSVGIQQLPVLAYIGEQSPNHSVFGQTIDSRVVDGVTWQVCAYWAIESLSSELASFCSKRLVIGTRQLPHGAWTWSVQNGAGGTPSIVLQANDAHNTINLGIDADGYVHVWYDHHNNVLRYRKSTAPLASWTGALSSTLSMLGTNETSCTYPQRFYDPLGTMYFMMRMSGMSGDGSYYLMQYDEATTSWSACAGTGTNGLWIDGESTDPDYSPYPNDVPRFTADWDGAGTGFMHVAWTWRRALGLLNNNVCHMRWDGSTWSQWDGTAQTMPATWDNSRVILTVPESELFFNSPGSCLDANGRPHLAVIKTNGTDHQLYDLYFTGSAWNLQVLTAYSGATYPDFGRPAMQCDPDTNEVFFWGTSAFEADGIIQWKSDPGDFTTWTKSTFYAAEIGVHEPQMDQGMWDRDRLACIFTVRGRDISAGVETPRIVTRAPKGRTSTFDDEVWTRKHAIVIDADQVGTGGVTGYTVRLTRVHFADEVCDPSGSNNARKDGGDLRFFSESALTTPIACDVLRFGHDSSTSAGDAVVNVDVGPLTLSDSADTTIYVAYGAPGHVHQPFVDEALGALAAKDGGWKHDAPMLVDYGRHDVLDDLVETWAVGKLFNIGANGVAFDGTFPMQMETRERGIGSGFAVAVTMSDTSAGSATPMMIAADDSQNNRLLQFRLDTSGVPRIIRFNSSNTVTTNLAGTTVVRGAGLKRVAAEFHGAGTKIYVGGVVEGTDSITTAQHDDSAGEWHIGGRYRKTGTVGYADLMVGTLQRVEIHQPRGDAWWKTDANNLMSPATFAAPGAPASIAGGTNFDLTISSLLHAHTAENLTLQFDGALTVADLGHAHALESPTLSADLGLAVADALHAHTVGAVTLSADAQLGVSDAAHGHALDAATLSADMALAAADLGHTHTVESATLSADLGLLVADAAHNHTAENLTLTSTDAETLAVSDALHAHSMDSLTLSTAATLIVQDVLHAHPVESLTLSAALALVIADASHAHTADAVELLTGLGLTVQDATHAHVIDGVALDTAIALAIHDATHALTVDAVTLSTITTLLINDAVHQHLMDSVGVFIPSPASEVLRKSVFVRVEQFRAFARVETPQAFTRV